MTTRIFTSLTLSLCVLFLCATFAHAAQEPVGRVLGVKGTATVVHQGSSKAEKLAVNASVYLMDRINTGGQSKVKMQMKDETIVTLGQDGEMVINEFVYKPETSTRKAALKLVKGAVRSFISKMFAGIGSAFEVHTPTAVAGARGTHNLVHVISNRRTLVIGISSITTVGNSDPNVPGEETLTDNHGSYVDFGLPPSPPFVVPDNLLQPLMDQTNVQDESGGNGGGDNGGGDGDTSGGDGFAPPDQPPADTGGTLPPPPPPPAPPISSVQPGGYLASIDTAMIWSGTLADPVTFSTSDGGTIFDFALHHPGLPDATFGVDTTDPYQITFLPIPGLIDPSSVYVKESMTGGIIGATDIWGADLSQYSVSLFTPDKDFFYFGLSDTPFRTEPRLNGVDGCVGKITPSSALPNSGVSIYAMAGESLSPPLLANLEALGSENFSTAITVDWAKGLVYGAGGTDDSVIILGKVDRATSQAHVMVMGREQRTWAGYTGDWPGQGVRYFTDGAGGNAPVQFFGEKGPAGFGGAFPFNNYDEDKTLFSGAAGVVGFRMGDYPVFSPAADIETTWQGFAVGFLHNRSNGDLTLTSNSDKSDVTMTLSPSTGSFTGEINTTDPSEGQHNLSVGQIFGDNNVFINPQAFGAARLLNGTPAFIGVSSVDTYMDPYDYLTWGVWSMDEGTVPEQTIYRSSPWIAGSLTPDNFLQSPINATATFNGTVIGQMFSSADMATGALESIYGTTTLTANFDARTLTGTFDNLYRSDSTFGGSLWIPTANVDAHWGTGITGNPINSITGTIDDGDGGHSGTVNGAFFGPHAEEVGGNWTLSSDTDQAGGIFRARQGMTP